MCTTTGRYLTNWWQSVVVGDQAVHVLCTGGSRLNVDIQFKNEGRFYTFIIYNEIFLLLYMLSIICSRLQMLMKLITDTSIEKLIAQMTLFIIRQGLSGVFFWVPVFWELTMTYENGLYTLKQIWDLIILVTKWIRMNVCHVTNITRRRITCMVDNQLEHLTYFVENHCHLIEELVLLFFLVTILYNQDYKQINSYSHFQPFA